MIIICGGAEKRQFFNGLLGFAAGYCVAYATRYPGALKESEQESAWNIAFSGAPLSRRWFLHGVSFAKWGVHDTEFYRKLRRLYELTLSDNETRQQLLRLPYVAVTWRFTSIESAVEAYRIILLSEQVLESDERVVLHHIIDAHEVAMLYSKGELQTTGP